MNPNSGGNPAVQTYDAQALALLSAYRQAAMQNQQSTGGLPDDLRVQIQDYLRQVNQAVSPAEYLESAVLGPAQYADALAPDGVSTVKRRLKVRIDDYHRQVFTAKEQMADQLHAMIAEAEPIVEAAYAAVVPQSRLSIGAMSDATLADRKQDISALIEKGGMATAQQLVAAAVRERDALTLYVLLGDPCRFTRQLAGIDDLALYRFAFTQQAGNGQLPAAFGNGARPGAAWLNLQLDERTSLGGVAALAEAYFRHQLAQVRAYIA